MPLAWDQKGTCYRFETLGVGTQLGDSPKADQFVKVIQELMPTNPVQSPIQKKVKDVQRIIHFQELYSGHDTATYLRKNILYHKWSGGRFSAHQSEGPPTNVHLDAWLYFTDLDVMCEFGLWILLFCLLVRWLVQKVI